jgi:hypothetical protein
MSDFYRSLFCGTKKPLTAEQQAELDKLEKEIAEELAKLTNEELEAAWNKLKENK